MDKIEQCVSDVVAIANGTRDREQAMAGMKELLGDAKFPIGTVVQHRAQAARSAPRVS